MEIEIATIGGYEEVGRQMTAIRAGDDIVVFDMGLNLSKVLIHDNLRVEGMHSLDLIDMGAIPDDRVVMSELDGTVQAIVPTHGHLDHIGAISKLAHRYDAPIVATPFTLALVEEEIDDENKFQVQNDLVEMEAGETMQIGERCELEFVNVTHSIIDAINPVLHTPEGAVVYGLDKRMDHTPVIGDPIDMKRFREIGREDEGSSATSRTARTRTGRPDPERGRRPGAAPRRDDEPGGLRRRHRRHYLLLAHRPRLLARRVRRRIGREPVLLGRSMEQYSGTADRIGAVDLPDDIGMYGHRKSVDRAFERIMNEGRRTSSPSSPATRANRARCSPGWGGARRRTNSTRATRCSSRPASSPSPPTRASATSPRRCSACRAPASTTTSTSRATSVRRGHYEMLDALQPQHVIPPTRDMKGFSGYVDLASSQGYELGRDLHVTQNGNTIQIV